MLYMNVAEGCLPTARILSELLIERGVNISTVEGSSTAQLCWGNGYNGSKPSLNRNCTQFNKLSQLQVLSSPESHNLRTIPFRPFNDQAYHANDFPAFARKLSHAGGTDIRILLEPEHASLYARNDWNFMTKYVPNQREYRVWAYRRQHLGTYEKVLARPAEFLASRRFGANFDNGYAFQLVASENVPRQAVEMASQAVNALGLDFGAVDMLLGRDGNFYILEVNTAPGVEGPDRQVIRLLADKIAWWVNHNYPRRNGDEGAYTRPANNRNQSDRIALPSLTEDAEEDANDDYEPPVSRPSFLPRRGETFAEWQNRVGI
jgi:hypothetical protein